MKKMTGALQQFLNHLRVSHYSERSIEEYVREVRFLFAFLEDRGITKLSDIHRDDLREYQTHLFHQKKKDDVPLSLSTQAKKISAIRSFFAFLVKERYLLYDPSSDIERPRLGKRLPRGILSQREAAKLLSMPDDRTALGIRDKAILELFYATGMRNTELRMLKLQDVDLGRGEVRIDHGKGRHSRIVPVGEMAGQAISRYLDFSRPQLVHERDDGWLFLSVNGLRLGRSGLGVIMAKYVKKARIKTPITCHSLRHTCATHMLKNNAGLRYIQELLGHQCLSTTQIYTKVELSDLKRVHAKCHPRNRR